MASHNPTYDATYLDRPIARTDCGSTSNPTAFVVTLAGQEFEVKGDRSVVGGDRILIIYKGSREVALFNDWICVRAKEVD